MTAPATVPVGDGDPGWTRVQRAYSEGVRVLQRLGFEYVDWTLPAGPAGRPAIELAGHVASRVRSYHRLLDAALAGAPLRDLPRGDDLGGTAPTEPAAVGAGADRIVAFDAIATRYGERVGETDPDLVLAQWEGLGALSVRHHTLAAAVEWHLHAWDLARALGWDHRPADPELLFDGRRLLGASLPGGDAWSAVLAASGRRPPGR